MKVNIFPYKKQEYVIHILLEKKPFKSISVNLTCHFINGEITCTHPLYMRYQYKRRMVQKKDLQTLDQYKRRTSTIIGPVQTSDWYKRRTSTNVSLLCYMYVSVENKKLKGNYV